MQDAVIVSAARTAVGKAPRGALRETPPEALATAAVRAALDRVPGLDPAEVGDLVLGCAMPEGAQGLNVARLVGLGAGLPEGVSAMTVNRFCASGLQSIALATQAVAFGSADVVVAAGMESMSFVPMTGWHYEPDPGLAGSWPGAFLSMGLTAEEVASRFGVDRGAQDAWALRSHQRAAAAQAAGLFRDEIVPVAARTTIVEDGRPRVDELAFEDDEGIRRDTDAARLASLKPAFRVGGTVTAGNSSQTSDGAAALVVMSGARAAALGLTPLGRLVSYATVGVDPEIMGVGPVQAIPKALAQAGLALDDISVIELNEAFASQVVEIVRRLGLDEARVNPNGGAIALGHPLGATGAKLTTQILSELARREARYGMVTMCVGGGQGAAGVIEWLGGRQAVRDVHGRAGGDGGDAGATKEAA